jgi:hypothetical protein
VVLATRDLEDVWDKVEGKRLTYSVDDHLVDCLPCAPQSDDLFGKHVAVHLVVFACEVLFVEG